MTPAWMRISGTAVVSHSVPRRRAPSSQRPGVGPSAGAVGPAGPVDGEPEAVGADDHVAGGEQALDDRVARHRQVVAGAGGVDHQVGVEERLRRVGEPDRQATVALPRVGHRGHPAAHDAQLAAVEQGGQPGADGGRGAVAVHVPPGEPAPQDVALLAVAELAPDVVGPGPDVVDDGLPVVLACGRGG